MTAVMPSLWRRLRYTPLGDVLRGRVDGQLDWRRIVAQADLPAEAAETISLIVGKTRLWRAEKVDVATELIAHFRDGLDAGHNVHVLVETFGLPKPAAQLIRRSKRRCRPLVWQAWWWASRSFAALFAAYVFTAFLLAFDRPKISTDYLAVLNQQVAALPEEERAWPHYLLALEWLKTNLEAPPESREVDNPSVYHWLVEPRDGETRLLDEYYSLVDAQRKVVDTWLDERAEFLALLRKAASRRCLGLAPGDYSPQFRRLFGMRSHDAKAAEKESSVESSLFYVLLPHVQAMRYLSQAMRADLQRSARQGDDATALADLQAIIGIARHSGDEPWLLCGLVKCGLLNSAIKSLETVLTTHPEIWSDQQLVEAVHLLSAVSLEVGDYVQGEKMGFYDLVQRLYSDDGNGDGYLTAEGLRRLDRDFRPPGGTFGILQPPHFSDWQYLAAGPATYFVAASRQEIVAKNDEIWARMQSEADRPLWDPLPPEESVDSQLARTSRIEQLRYAPLYMCLPAYQAAARTFEKANGRLDGALTGIALELYRREHGDWPESLAQLSPHWLPEVPIDRINGGPLGYRLLEGQPIVYSLGTDTDDDNGALPERCVGNARYYVVRGPSTSVDPGQDGDWVIWSTAKPSAEVGLRIEE